MKVKKMIEELKKYDKDAEIRMHGYQGEPVLFVLGMAGENKNVWLESEEDCDLGAELSERFKTAVDEQLDEMDFYNDLLETGFTIDCVKRYLGDDVGEHMQNFCVEHGLID